MISRSILRAGFALMLAAAAPLIAPDFAEAKPKRGKKDKDKDKEKDADTAPPIITHVRVTRAAAEKEIVIRAKFDDESEIFAPSVYVRASGAVEFDTIAMKRGTDGWEATIPGSQVTSNLEYFIEAFDEQGNGPAREGAPELPIKITVVDRSKGGTIADPTPPIVASGGNASGGSGAAGGSATKTTPAASAPSELPKASPAPAPAQNTEVVQAERLRDRHEGGIAEEWWFWTLIGLAVTGGVVGTVLVLQKGGTSVSSVDVQVLGPDPTRGL